MGHIILVHRMENIQNIWRKSITNNSYTTHATHTAHATLLQSCYCLNYSLRMAQIWPIMTHDDWVWQGMTYQGSGGLQGVQGGVRGHQGSLGASRLLPMPKWVIKQQNNGSKPWLKVPEVCPDPKFMVFTHFWSIWGHLDAVKQCYTVKMQYCQNHWFLDILLCPLQPTKRCNFWMVS